jgi:hypothetical protein
MPSQEIASFPRLADSSSQSRDVSWLSRQVAMCVVALGAALLLIQYGYLLVAERALVFVAQDAVRFAQLPRVTSGEVHRQIDDRLAQLGWNTPASRVALTADGAPLSSVTAPRPGQRLHATIAVPAEAILPAALAAISQYAGLDEVVVHRAAIVQ